MCFNCYIFYHNVFERSSYTVCKYIECSSLICKNNNNNKKTMTTTTTKNIDNNNNSNYNNDNDSNSNYNNNNNNSNYNNNNNDNNNRNSNYNNNERLNTDISYELQKVSLDYFRPSRAYSYYLVRISS